MSGVVPGFSLIFLTPDPPPDPDPQTPNFPCDPNTCYRLPLYCRLGWHLPGIGN